MNKIVREHYPVDRLPKDLQGELGDARLVTVTIERERAPIGKDDLVRQLREEKARMKPGEGVSMEEAVARVRTLRDEWDD